MLGTRISANLVEVRTVYDNTAPSSQSKLPKMILRYILLATFFASALSACGNPIWLPPAHKIDVQQGNLVEQEQIDQLREGMGRAEVQRILGQPVLESTLNPNRWDYVYTKGVSGEKVKARTLSVYFKNEQVTQIVDAYQPTKN